MSLALPSPAFSSPSFFSTLTHDDDPSSLSDSGSSSFSSLLSPHISNSTPASGSALNFELAAREKTFFKVGEKRGCPANLHYKLYGDENSPHKVVFVMGLAAPHTIWETQVSFFVSQGFQCLTPDHRGCGHSESPAHRYTTRLLAQDVAEICDSIGWNNHSIHVVGFSMGGMIAQELWDYWDNSPTQNPNQKKRIASLSLCATHRGGLHRFDWFPTLECMWKFAALPFHNTNQGRITHMLDLIYSKAHLDGEEGGVDKRKLRVMEVMALERGIPVSSPVGVFAHIGAVMTHHFTDAKIQQLKTSGIPVLVVCGRHDKIVKTQNNNGSTSSP